MPTTKPNPTIHSAHSIPNPFSQLSQRVGFMEATATAIACRDGDHKNKENIPPTPAPIPFSATAKAMAKLINPVAETMSSSKKCNKMRHLRRRKPLADVTNLYFYNNSVQSPGWPPLSFSSSSVSASAFNYRKRKSAEDFNSITVASSNSKSLRMGFR